MNKTTQEQYIRVDLFISFDVSVDLYILQQEVNCAT